MIISPYQKPFRGLQFNKAHPLARGLVGCWVMNEGSGGKIYDLSGNGNEGILENGPEWIPGRFGQCLKFAGANDYVDCGNDGTLKLSQGGSISSWFKLNSWNGASYSNSIIEKGAGSSWINHHYILFKYTGSHKMVLSVSDGANWLGGSGPYTSDLELDVWYYIVATWDSSQKRMYLDGVETQCVDSTIMPKDSAASVNIGRAQSNEYYLDGVTSKVDIYNRALTAQEIAWLYREPFAMFEPYIDPAMLYVIAGGQIYELSASISGASGAGTPSMNVLRELSASIGL